MNYLTHFWKAEQAEPLCQTGPDLLRMCLTFLCVENANEAGKAPPVQTVRCEPTVRTQRAETERI